MSLSDDHDVRDLEAELRADRPEPRPDFLQGLVSRMDAVAPARRDHRGAEVARVRRRPARLLLASGFAALMLTVLAAFGGAGYAKSSLVSAVKGSTSAVASIVRGGDERSDRADQARQSGSANAAARAASGNSGAGNQGNGNSGIGNSGDGNSGIGNQGNGNSGIGNSGNGNSGIGNSGNGNSGICNSGNGNSGIGRDCAFDPPFFHQYSRFVLVCYPFTTPSGNLRYRTIVVPRQLVGNFVPPGTLGPCGFRPR